MAGTEISSSVPQPDVEDVLIDPADPQFNGNGEDAEIEAQAREMGWKPFAEYRGTPGRWQPAAQFIERGNEILPIVRANNHRLIERVGRLEGELNGLRATAGEQLEIIKELRERGKTADQRGYDRAMNEIRAKQRQAAEAGDVKTFDQLVEQAEALASERPTAALVAPTPPAVTQPSAPVLSEPTKQFFADNPWMNTKGLLSDTMIAFHQEILNERQATQAILNADPELDRELLDEAKRRVMAKYPERFGLPPTREPAPAARTQRRAASVAAPTPEPPAPRPGATPTINSITDPAERAQAREAFNRIKRQLPDYTEAEYMKVYDDPHVDILVEQQKRKTQPNGR